MVSYDPGGQTKERVQLKLEKNTVLVDFWTSFFQVQIHCFVDLLFSKTMCFAFTLLESFSLFDKIFSGPQDDNKSEGRKKSAVLLSLYYYTFISNTLYNSVRLVRGIPTQHNSKLHVGNAS